MCIHCYIVTEYRQKQNIDQTVPNQQAEWTNLHFMNCNGVFVFP